ncbi:MAG: redoxin domain-containing protein [Dehalococcoidia bacterium]|nr:redoxin domain-containing protein [Dehalococcoidia bacterium]
MNKLLKAMLVITFALVLALGFTIAGCSSSSTPSDIEGLPSYRLQINLLGEKNEFFVDNQGRLKSRVEVSSTDSKIGLSLDKGTTILDKDTQPLPAIHVAIDPDSPPPSENAYIISSVYNLEPQGATFDPQLSLTLSYEPEELPEGLSENDLYIAYHDGAEWHKLPYKRVDTKVHSITTQLYSLEFTSFAILGSKEPIPSSPPIPTEGTKVGNLAPDFQLHDLEGKSVSLSDLRGKPVMLNFWATTCYPCVIEMPYFQEVHEEWSAKGLVLLAVNINGTSSQVTQFSDSLNLCFPMLLGAKTDVPGNYNLQYIPTTFFIDKDGIIQFMQVGPFTSKETIEDELNKIML